MAKPDRQQSPEIRRSEQAVQNWSFDEVYKVLSTVGLAEYANALYRLQADSDGNLKVNIASGTVDVDTTGLATETKQDDIITELQTIVPQTDALTDTQLRATPVSVSGTVTATPTGTQNVDVTANTIGLATSAKQDTIIGHVDGLETAVASTNTKLDTVNTNLGTIDADTGSLASTVVGGQLQVDIAGVSTTLYVEQPTASALHTTEVNSAAIKTAVETIDNAISGSEMQVDVVGALPAGTNAIGKLAANSGVDIGDVDVTSISAGTNTIGAIVPSGHASAGTGLTPYFDSDGDNTAQTMKNSAGRLYFLEVTNTNTSDAYIQLFDEAGSITVGSTTPKLSLLVPASGGMDKIFTIGVNFANSIKYACTTTATGSTDPTTGLTVNAGYV